MTKIRWSSDQLQAFDEGFRKRVGFHPPTPKVPSGKTVPNYLASLSDKQFMTLGRAVYAETKVLVNGWCKISWLFLLNKPSAFLPNFVVTLTSFASRLNIGSPYYWS